MLSEVLIAILISTLLISALLKLEHGTAHERAIVMERLRSEVRLHNWRDILSDSQRCPILRRGGKPSTATCTRSDGTTALFVLD